MTAAVDRLTALLQDAGSERLVVVTGAGVSRASGIATFRGSEPDAVWRQSDLELATFGYFLRDPVGQWSWYLERFRAIEGARPNPAHRAIADLERLVERRGGALTTVTQNIDSLHEMAGSRRLIKVHGTADRLRCSRPGCDLGAPRGSLPRDEAALARFRERPELATLPTCPRCAAFLRAHVLFFDEYYQDHDDYRFEEVIAAAEEAALMLFVGTSFSVGITDLLLRAAVRRRLPAASLDPAAGHATPPGLEPLAGSAEEVLPEAVRRIQEALLV